MENVLQFTPMLLALIAGFMLYGDSFGAICFRQIDLPLLYQHMYNDEMLKKSIYTRYLYLLGHSLRILFAVAVNIIFILWIGRIYLEPVQISMVLLFMGCFIVTSEIYHLILYYLFQPYNMDITVKNPLFQMLGVIEVLFDFALLFIRKNLTMICIPAVLVCVFMNLLLFALIERYKVTFRLKY